MHNSRWWAVGAALALTLFALALAPEPLAARPANAAAAGPIPYYYVAPGGDCGGQTPCYGSVQAAIAAAPVLGEIRLAAGRYTGVFCTNEISAVAVITKPLILSGGYTPSNWTDADPVANPTILDPLGLGRAVVISQTNYVTIRGLTLTGGNANGQGGAPMAGQDAGGGLYLTHAVSVTLLNNIIISNTADHQAGQAGWGGGLFIEGCAGVTLVGNAIRDNAGNARAAGSGYGGGLYIGDSDHITLRDNVIAGNTAGAANGVGGGLYLTRCDDATLTGNVWADNTAALGGEGRGGGAYIANGARMTARGNRLERNIASAAGAGDGGGLYLLGGSGAAWDGLIASANVAAGAPGQRGQGGGVYALETDARFINLVLVENDAHTAGGGLYAAGASPTLIHPTLARNAGPGGALCAAADPGGFIDSDVHVTNAIIAGHALGAAAGPGSAIALDATLWYNNDAQATGAVARSADHHGDPAFAPDGYHLRPNSAARGLGVEAAAPADLDGQPRTACGGYDLGADELPCLALPAIVD